MGIVLSGVLAVWQRTAQLLSGLIALIALALLCSASVFANSTIHCPAQPLRVAFDDRGFNYYKGKGFDLDITKELAKRSGCAMTYSEVPRARIFDGLERGDLDMAMFALANPDRERFAWFAPYMVQKNYVIVAPAFKNKYRSMAEFEADPNAIFGVVRGFVHGANYEAFLKRLRGANRVIEVTNSESLFRIVTANRVQAVMSLPTVKSLYAHNMVPELAGTSNVDWDDAAAAPPHCLMMAKKTISEENSKAWQALMADMVKDGTVKRILATYVSGDDLKRSLMK